MGSLFSIFYREEEQVAFAQDIQDQEEIYLHETCGTKAEVKAQPKFAISAPWNFCAHCCMPRCCSFRIATPQARYRAHGDQQGLPARVPSIKFHRRGSVAYQMTQTAISIHMVRYARWVRSICPIIMFLNWKCWQMYSMSHLILVAGQQIPGCLRITSGSEREVMPKG